jgi:hypothetical protein
MQKKKKKRKKKSLKILIFENFNMSENNITSVKATEILWYHPFNLRDLAY